LRSRLRSRSIAIAGALLPIALPGLPAVKLSGAANFAGTCAEIAAAALVAAWLPRSAPGWTAAPIAVGLSLALFAAWASIPSWVPGRAPQVESAVASIPEPPAASAPAPAAAPAAAAMPPKPPAPEPLEKEGYKLLVPEPDEPGWEELERRRAAAARIQKLIEAGPHATGPAIAGGLLAEGDPQPIYENGELRGIELQHLRPDGLYTRLGLREGDLVQSINGIQLDASGALLREIARSRTLELAVERSDGTQERISVPREQIIEGLKRLE